MSVTIYDFYKANAVKNVSFATWLGIDAHLFVSYPISALTVPVRGYNCLRRKGCTTVADVLCLGLFDLMQMRGMGAKTVDEVIVCVLDFLTFTLGNLKQRTVLEPENIVAIVGPALPEEIQGLPIGNFAQVFSEYVCNLPSGLVPDLSESVSSWDTRTVTPEFANHRVRFRNWLSQDVRSTVATVFTDADLDERQFRFMQGRMLGITLDKLADGLSRERVRQIERRGVEKLLGALQRNNFFLKLFAMYGNPACIKREVLSRFMSEDQMNLICWSILQDQQERFSLDFPFIFETACDGVLSKNGLAQFKLLEDYIAKLPAIIDSQQMSPILTELVCDRGFDKNVVWDVVTKRFTIYPYVYVDGKPSLTEMIGYILRVKYPKGIRITMEAELEDFITTLRTCFGFKDDISGRFVQHVVNKNGILCSPGTYVHPSNLTVDLSVLKEVNDYLVGELSRTTISYTELFNKFHDQLVSSGVQNAFVLHGLLSYYGCPFVVGKDYVYKVEGCTFEDDFVEYIKMNGAVLFRKVMEHFCLSEPQCWQVLYRCPAVKVKDKHIVYIPPVKAGSGVR